MNVADRLWSKALADGTGCWLWTGFVHPSGYGRITVGGRVEQAHRVAYELTNGRIPAGAHIVHKCRRRSCVQPRHLDAVTQRENNKRAGAAHRMPSVCKHGHPMATNGVLRAGRGNSWSCRTCNRNKTRRHRARLEGVTPF